MATLIPVDLPKGGETAFTAFSERKRSEHFEGRLVVRRSPELNPKEAAGKPTLFDTHRLHAFFATNTYRRFTAARQYPIRDISLTRRSPSRSMSEFFIAVGDG